MAAWMLALCVWLPSVRAEAPAKVTCSVQENGKAASGAVRVMAGDREVAKGSCGTPLDVPAGDYDVVVSLDGAADSPVQREHVTAKAGQTASVKARFETGELLVEVTRGGKRALASIKLLRAGQTLATLSTGVATRVSTGTYSVEVDVRGEKRSFDAVSIASGERRVISVDYGG